MFILLFAYMCREQLDQHVDEVRLCIYALLAGRLVWKTSDIFINTCRLLDWKRCFALHLWWDSYT